MHDEFVHRTADPIIASFTAYGRPVAQGSMNSYKGRVWSSNAGPLAIWRSTVREAAAKDWGEKPPVRGRGIEVRMQFYFRRPKGHYGTGRNEGKLKPSAPFHHVKTPDLDKLVRAVLDSLSGLVYHDDSQCVWVQAIKGYDDVERCEVSIIDKG